jgi:platelet-activating factor acetylhydrolase isoform II
MRRATSNLVRVNFTALLSLLGAGLTGATTLGCSSDDDEPAQSVGTTTSALEYEAGNTTFCLTDEGRGFNPTGGIADGRRLVIVEAWYPTAAATAQDPDAVRTRFGDYFASDADLLLRTEQNLLERTGWMPNVIAEKIQLAPGTFDVLRGSYRDAPVADGPFPVVLYSHGTLQQRFTNDTMAENLAKRGYIVLAAEHTGNDALAAFGDYCQGEIEAPGVMPLSLPDNPDFDMLLREYKGVTFDPFFLVGDAAPDGVGVINPVEVALTLDRVADYRLILDALPSGLGAVGAAADRDQVGMVGYSRGAMHGSVGAELIPEIKVTVGLVGGTPLRFYERDAEAQPINDAMMAASSGRRVMLNRISKPMVDLIGGEDARRKATSDVAGMLGVYPMPSADNPSPLVLDTFNSTDAFRSLIRVEGIDHFDLVDDPFVVAYRAVEGTVRPGAFDPQTSYTLRPLSERQAIRDHFVLATLDKFLKELSSDELFTDERFADQGVSVTMGN